MSETNHVLTLDDRKPQRFRYRHIGQSEWIFGYCYPVTFDSVQQWQICVQCGSGFSSFDEDPWEILGQIIGGDVEVFEWFDNDYGWHGDLVKL